MRPNTENCRYPEPADDDEKRNLEVLVYIGRRLRAGDLVEENVREWFMRFRLYERWNIMSRNSCFVGGARLPEVLGRWLGLQLEDVEEMSFSEWATWVSECYAEKYEQEFVDYENVMQAYIRGDLPLPRGKVLDVMVDRLFNGGE